MKLIEKKLLKIAQLAQIREEENIRFRTFLKGRDNEKVDKIVHRLHSAISSVIDCKQCGNCCMALAPEVTSEEINRYAELDNLSVEEYQKQYCKKDELGENAIFLKNQPCRYLTGKECSIYDIRPHECRMYPYTQEDGFVSRLWGMLSYYSVCPIVFNVMEELKDELGFRRRNNNRR